MGGIWNIFVGFLEQALLWCALFTGNAGLGIILFTVCARLLILPLTLSSIRSSRRMQELQPKIKELQRKHGKDQRKLQEETVKLYQEHKVNPVGGCLPMLLQLPIFIGVYWAVLHLMEPATHSPVNSHVLQQLNDPTVQQLLLQPFLGIQLGIKPFDEGFKNFHGPQYLVLPILSILLQYTQQLMAMPRTQDPQQKAMSRAMLIMPLFFGYITFIFPSGAVLYWTTSSIVGIVQQYFTSGWGSLANYLTFLPADKKSKQSPVVAAESSDQPGGSVPSALAERPTFWDVLRPLTEGADSDGALDESLSSTDHPLQSGQQMEQKAGTAPRRQRRRR